MSMGKTLIEILEQFENNKKKWEGTWNENAVAECFKPCAIDLLCNGYFLVNGKYIIDLGAIELYYHEEKENGIKDYIMYHIPERYQNPKTGVMKLEKKQHNQLPYFKLGSFNLHQSGVDVTFEKPNEYRASFLIRSYRVLIADNDGKYPKVVGNVDYDNHSTHIFDDMFYSGVLLSNTEKDKKTTIEWVWMDESKNVEFDKKSYPRINVSEYLKDEKGEYKKDDKGNYIKNEKNKDEYQTAKKDAINNNWPKIFESSSKYYSQDMRPWQFRIKGIQEMDNSYKKYYDK